MGRILALDIGDVRIGIAMSDILKMIANPISTLNRRNLNFDISHIIDIIKNNDVETIVCGLPLSMDGGENTQTIKTREFVEELKTATSLPVVFQDERFSSKTAEEVLIKAEMRREKRKTVIDKVAATIILQNYLDKKH